MENKLLEVEAHSGGQMCRLRLGNGVGRSIG